MKKNRLSTGGLRGLLHDPAVRSLEHDGRLFYAVLDLLSELLLDDTASKVWTDLIARRPELQAAVKTLPFPDGSTLQALDLEGALRLIQSVKAPRAEKIRWWLAETGRAALEEADNPELALAKARKLYEAQGHDRNWVDKRLRAISARHELTGEWYRRGARSSDDYRALTNALFTEIFGSDVESLRAHKGLTQTSENLRDHLTDLELTVTTLAETAAATLHRAHNSNSLPDLHADIHLAGQIAARTFRDLTAATRPTPASASAA